MNKEQTEKLKEIERKVSSAYKSLEELTKEISTSLKKYDDDTIVDELQNAVNITCDAIDAIQYCKDEFGCQIY